MENENDNLNEKELNNQNLRSVEISFGNTSLGFLKELPSHNQGRYTYYSNTQNENKVAEEYFLPLSYENSMMGSNGEDIGERQFIEDIVAKLSRKDLVNQLGINDNDNSFDRFYKLSQEKTFIGENFDFKIIENDNNINGQEQ